MELPGGANSIVGRNLTVPDRYAGLLPVHPDARIFSVIEGKDNGKQNVAIAARIQSPIQPVIDWHVQKLQSMGYVIYDKNTLQEVTNIWFSDSRYKGSVTLSNKDYAHPGQTTREVRVSYWLEIQ